MRVTKDLTEGNLAKNYILYILPLLLSSLLSSAYSTVDAMIAGKFISEHALGAISSTGSYDTVFHSFFLGFGSGFAVYVAHLFGKKDYASMKRNIIQMIAIVASAAIVVSVFTICYRDPIMDYLKVDPILRDDAETYFVIYSAGYALIYTNLILIRTLQSLGVTSFSLYMSLISALLNIGGNLLSVLVFDLGVAGLALSTLFSTVVATIFYLYMLKRAFRELKCGRTRIGFSLAGLKNSVHYAFPAAFQQVAFHGIGFFIAPLINGLGAAATTGYNVANRMYSICGQSFWSATSAVSTHTAQCVGAGKYERIQRGFNFGLFLNCALLFPFVVVFVIFAEPIALIFFPAGYAGESLQYAVRFSTFYMPFLYINMIGHQIHAYLRGLGVMNVVFGITVFGSLVRLAATFFLAPVIGMEGVYLGQLISWSADALVSVILYLSMYRTKAHIDKVIQKIHK